MKREDMLSFIIELNESEMIKFVRTFLSQNPESIKKAYRLAKDIADQPDPEVISDEVFTELDLYDFDDLNAQVAGADGYIDEVDAIGELFEKAVEPLMDEMRKKIKLGLAGAAKAYCVGIIEGLRQFVEEGTSELSDWFVDLPEEGARQALKEWLASEPAEADKAEVMKLFPEEWRDGDLFR
ncbi:MAG: hypothetical protein LBJ64_07670 [Deltaproteobacteria bacterium]|jgi:hypothetical protein|nr:hypothetical protein [Deltaproteobacteria bacterium]